MGIQVEFNPDLALRNISEFKNDNRKIEECVPDPLEVDKEYRFLKTGQRNYWLHGELPLRETDGKGNLSPSKASIIILETTHFVQNKTPYTKGIYKIVEIFEDDEIHFEGFEKIN